MQAGEFGFPLLAAGFPTAAAVGHVGAVIAAVGFQPVGAEFPNGLRHLVEEVTVVGNEQHRALILLQKAFQEGHGLNVEVVGGLVQHQQVGGFEEQAGEVRAGALAAGKLAQGAGEIGFAEAHALQNALQAALVGVASAALEFGLQATVAGDAFGGSRVPLHGRRHFGQAGFHAAQVIQCGRDEIVQGGLPRGAFQHGFGVLRQIADAQALGALHAAFGGFLFADEDAQQGGFAHAVGANDADARAVRHAEADVLE